MKPRLPSLVLILATLSAAGVASCGDHDHVPGEVFCTVKPSETFHDRIEPLLVDDHLATCNECHLSGVDLSAFARPTQCQTWACLLDQGLVNPSSPADSRILGWIERAKPNSDLITPAVIQAEYDAFRSWIESHAACPNACEGVPCGDPKSGPTCSDGMEIPDTPPPVGEDTRGCGDQDLEQAFYDDVYTWRGRCYPCHFDTEAKNAEGAPAWISAVGNCATGSAVTFKRARTLGLINTTNASQSLLLLKPLDVSGGGIKHGGGAKFSKENVSYLSFRRFLEHYQKCKQQAP